MVGILTKAISLTRLSSFAFDKNPKKLTGFVGFYIKYNNFDKIFLFRCYFFNQKRPNPQNEMQALRIF